LSMASSTASTVCARPASDFCSCRHTARQTVHVLRAHHLSCTLCSCSRLSVCVHLHCMCCSAVPPRTSSITPSISEVSLLSVWSGFTGTEELRRMLKRLSFCAHAAHTEHRTRP
jgi:hypothetical protein